jgi:import receptor subunit TOM70
MNFKSKGNKCFRDLKYDEAIDCYSNAINDCPKDKTEELSTFYQNRAASYEMLRKYEEVIEDCNQAIDLNKRYVKALVRRAKAQEAIGNTSSALFDITAVCILEQFQNQTNLMMTDRLLREQSKVKAKALFKSRTPRLPSEHFISHYFMSYSKDPILKNCEPKDIVQHLEELKQKQEGSDQPLPEYLLLRGTIEILKGNIENGEKDLEELIKLNNCDLDIKVNSLIKLGTIKVQDIGREDSFTTALKCFDEAINLDANNPDIYLHRAQVCNRKA